MSRSRAVLLVVALRYLRSQRQRPRAPPARRWCVTREVAGALSSLAGLMTVTLVVLVLVARPVRTTHETSPC